MTPIEEADLAQRRWIVLRLVAAAIFLVIAAVALVAIWELHAPAVGVTLLLGAIAASIAFPFVANMVANRRLPSTRVTAEVPEIARKRAAAWSSED